MKKLNINGLIKIHMNIIDIYIYIVPFVIFHTPSLSKIQQNLNYHVMNLHNHSQTYY